MTARKPSGRIQNLWYAASVQSIRNGACKLFAGLFFWSVVAVTGAVQAQEWQEASGQVDRDIEIMLEGIDSEEENPEEIAERILDLAANPLNINRASAGQLLMVPGMTQALASSIVEYRRQVRPFRSVDELTVVDGIGPATRDRFRPYLSTGDDRDLRRDYYLNPGAWTHNQRTTNFLRFRQVLEERDGYQIPDSSGGYLGSPAHIFQRTHYRSSHLSLNITQMKRPGEPGRETLLLSNASMHASIRDLGKLQMLAAGDYNLRFGQGLIMGSGGFGKGRNAIRSGTGNPNHLRGHTSSRSARAFRGFAGTFGNRLELTLFYSNRLRTASVVEGDTIRLPSQVVYLRTLNERQRLDNSIETTYGGRAQLQLPSGQVGISGYRNRFNKTVQGGSQPWQLYGFEGRSSSALSADIRLNAGDYQVYGEAGRTDSGGYGWIAGTEISRGDTRVALLHRYYSPHFQSIHGGSFAEQSGTPRNEQGWYLGLEQPVTGWLTLSGFIDLFEFPASRFQTDRPTDGYEWLVSADFQPRSSVEFYFLLRKKVRESTFTNSDPFGREFRQIAPDRRLAGRYHLAIRAHPRVRLRTRFDWIDNRPAGSAVSRGLLIYQDVRFHARENLILDARVTLFDTDGFDSRIYHFENDLLYVFSSTMLFDQGQRLYILLNYSPHERLQAWLKLATTIYENRNEISSGLNRIEGNRQSELGVQVRYTL